MNPKEIRISDFTYHLPEEKIAKHPLEKRDESKLLVYQNENGDIKTSNYKKIASEIPENSLLVFNNTKVVEARLLFTKNTGSVIEIFCLEPDDKYSDITTAMLQKQRVYWKCLIGGAKKWKEEILLKTIEDNETFFELTAKKIEKRNDYFLVELSWNDEQLSFAEVLHFAGKIPLPPYLNREVEDGDKETYQTVYAKYDGSVAAPTAGLHFSEFIFKSLEQKKIAVDYVTLHVGAGTFKPVKAETMQEHEMHSEFIDVDINTIKNIINNLSNKIIVVGTTSLRTIESLYWIGVKASQQSIGNVQQLNIDQWDCYELPQNIEPKIALENLVNWMLMNNHSKLMAKTQIIIAPGYELKIANGLITNFHQPNSTLLLLISAIVGDDWRKIYNYALENEYRFLSYGDGSLLWKNKQ
ncbi:MAG: S-adenosylmethionine:tRNA ribosyltransferase-isomerase [Bacteroidetes bacterium]|jgi:S-adenosylmethionine:tRNA ribosyltransferase-isomerase|nr:S-adenosylmethionine:tRNA ribosyltransferase-isomerase [Bacteroidota bacterium]